MKINIYKNGNRYSILYGEINPTLLAYLNADHPVFYPELLQEMLDYANTTRIRNNKR
jgi:hypothetical protein